MTEKEIVQALRCCTDHSCSAKCPAYQAGLDCREEMHTFSVRCNTCHARGGAVGGRVMNDPWTRCTQPPDWATTDKTLEAKAINAWNRRVNDG